MTELEKFIVQWLGFICLITFGYVLRLYHEEKNKRIKVRKLLSSQGINRGSRRMTIEESDLTKFDAFDYLFFVGFGLSPIKDNGINFGYEEAWFWKVSAEDRHCIIEQRLAEELIKAIEFKQ